MKLLPLVKIYIFLFVFLICIPVIAQDNTDEYTKTIELADRYFNEGDYINAKASYQYASTLAPDEIYPKEKLQESVALIKLQLQKSQEYAQKAMVADDLYREGDLDGARKLYEQAMEILPSDPYAQEKIREIDEIVAEIRRVEEGYSVNITNGDRSLESGDYSQSLDSYKKALEFKPEEAYPKEKIAEIEVLLASIESNLNEYDQALSLAEQFAGRKSYDNAIEQLNIAIKLRPEEQYPRDRLAEVQSIKEEYDKYTGRVDQADALYISKKFEEARALYEVILKDFPDDSYVQNQVARCDVAMEAIDKVNQSEYEQAISRADALFSQEDYENAVKQYMDALAFKPDAEYARSRIEEINKVVSLRKSQDEAYVQTIAKGDQLFREERYQEAREEFVKARDLKPLEQYPEVKIGEIDNILEAIKNEKESYDELIAGADKLFYSDEYIESKEQYLRALEIFPNQQYPENQITMINEILGLRDQYLKIITNANMLLGEENYREALVAFSQAAEIDPEADYPQEKISEIEILLAEQAAEERRLEEQYTQLLYKGDKAMKAGKYTDAIDIYQQASVIKPEEELPRNEIAFAEQKVFEYDQQLALDNNYNDLVSQGDAFLSSENYNQALEAFQSAATLKPEEAYPTGKINEINGILASMAAAAELEQQYANLIEEADDLYSNESYAEALPKYQEAHSLKPQEQHPAERISEIEGLLGEMERLAALENQYNGLIATADQLFDSESYTEALSKYKAALDLKPEEAYPAEKIDEINGLLDEMEQLAALQQQFNDLIDEADQHFENKDYEDALMKYQSALDLMPDETYPAEKIAEINALVVEMARLEALNNEYDELIAEADRMYGEESYEGALAKYRTASDLKPDEAYPSQRILEITGLLDEQSRVAAIEEEYNALITEADQLFDAESYQDALLKYQGALNLKPEESYPQEQIAAINGLLDEQARLEAIQKQYDDLIAEADQLFDTESYQDALARYQSAAQVKPEETYPGERIAEINGLLEEIAALAAAQKQYDDLIAEADQLFANKSYQDALAKYNAALSVMPEESYPSEKIREINSIVGEMERLAALQKQYDDMIAEADQLFNSQSYEEAILKYQAAADLLPDETYPAERIVEINQILEAIANQKQLEEDYASAISAGDEALASEDYELALAAYNEALALKPNEEFPPEKVAEINAVLAETARIEELERNYSALIIQADGLFAEGAYQESLDAYNDALELKPEEAYPPEKIAEIEVIITQLAEEAEIQRQYDEAISFAENHLAAEDFDNAVLEFKRANSIKPDEAYPLEQISSIEETLAEAERIRKLNADYQRAIDEADQFYTNKDYQSALVSYQQALNLKPEESYPQQQLDDIRFRLEEMAEERDEIYGSAITKADNYFDMQDYEMAKINYKSASQIKPDETYPIDMLKEVNELLLRQRQILQEEYEKAIADADKFYATKIYDNAIASYREAAMIKTDEAYPVEMIRKILKLITERAIVDINREPLLIKNNTTERFAFNPVPVAARKANYIFFKAKNLSNLEYKVILSYGKDGAKNGGVVVKVPPGEVEYEFLVRISAQYKWFSEDNNWITMYPEGGDFEVGLVQISNSE